MYIPVGAEKYKDMKQAERNVKQIKEDVIKRTVRKETE
jgi:thioredoxin-related protein